MKAYVKDETNNTKNLTTFTNYSRNVPIEDNKMMVSFGVRILCADIAVVDTWNIRIINISDQLLGTLYLNQDKFLDLLIWFYQPPGTLVIFNFTEKLMVLQWKGQHK